MNFSSLINYLNITNDNVNGNERYNEDDDYRGGYSRYDDERSRKETIFYSDIYSSPYSFLIFHFFVV